MGIIFKALEKSQHGSKIEHNTVHHIYNERLSGSDGKDSDSTIGEMHKKFGFIVYLSHKERSDDPEQFQRLKKFLFPEEYQKKIR